ncbi:MAG: prolyl oligopeptidase family serine peptidase [Firmicutes bacterium]|nr:prolyl oligopeptidase family serine peptidase [Bacillota bacterium]
MEPIDLSQVEALVQFPRPGLRVPMAFQFAEDGKTLYFLYAPAGEALSLWAADSSTGAVRLVAEPPEEAETTFAEEMRRQRARWAWGGITSYQWCHSKLLIPYAGRVYVKEGDGDLRRLPVADEVLTPRWAPDGNRIFGVINGNLVSIAVDSGKVCSLTTTAEPGVSYGLAEYVAQEELDRQVGFWLSPQGRTVILTEVDERHIPEFPLVHWGGDTVRTEVHRYPFVGQANAKVRLGLSPTDGPSDQCHWLDLDLSHRYLLDVLWVTEDTFLVLTLSRDQRHLAWDRYDVRGEYGGRVYEERVASYWINRPGRSYVSPKGGLLTTSERTGRRRLLIVSEDGEIYDEQAPENDAVVLDILAVNWETTTAYVWMTRQRALERTIAAIDWSHHRMRDLTPEPGWHQGVVAPLGKGWVDQVSSWDVSPATRWIEAPHASAPSYLIKPSEVRREALGLVRPTAFEVPVEPSLTLNAILYEPVSPPPPGGWPLVVFVYAGPHAQMVTAHWDETVDLPAQALAQRGFAVLKADSRGSANRGVDFERWLFRRFGQVELDDQVRAVHYVTAHWPVNPGRVGIFGWSYGGYMTIRALLMAPEIFRVGVAGAPVTDFRWYDTAYTERYLETPETNPDGYAATSLIDKVERLQGKLLLIHGLVDENVHFRHTARLIQALVDAGKDFDLILLPESRHMVQGLTNLVYRTRRTLSYFEEYL